MIVNVEVFYNTGFDYNNIPSSSVVLYNNFTPRSFADCAIKQNRTLAKIRIACSYTDIDGADYLVLTWNNTKTFYFVTNITMLNDNCAELDLMLDGLTTIGLSNIELVSGWCTRKHVSDDTLMSNILSEPFVPSHDLTLEVSDILKPSISKMADGTEINGKDINVVGASFNLLGDFNEATKYTVDDGSDAVVCPRCPKMPDTYDYTELHFSIPSFTSTFYKIPMTYLFDGSQLLVKENLNSARALGLDNGITSSYIIPRGYYLNVTRATIDDEQTYYSLFTRISSNYGTDMNTNIKYKYDVDGYTPMNNKVYALWNIFTLMSTCSGNRAEFKADEIYNPTSETFNLTFFADLAPNGKPYFAPSYYYGSTRNALNLAISGMPWQNQPIAYDRTSGSAFDVVNRQIELNQFLTADYRLEQARSNNTVSSIVGGLTGASGSVNKLNTNAWNNTATSWNAIANGAQSLYNWNLNKETYMYNEQNLNQAKQRSALAFNRSMNFNVPQITFPRDESLQNYVGNYVVVTRNHLSDNDVKRFDVFLNMYGYAVDEPLKMTDFTSRRLYNYVQARDVSIKTTSNVPLYIRNLVVSQITDGIRVWHTAPDVSLFNIKNEVV